MNLKFFTYGRFEDVSPNETCFYLRQDNWNDFGFKTTFYLYYYEDESIEIGTVKIGYYSVEEDTGTTSISSEFQSLSAEYFSLGQDVDYYKNLNKLGSELRNHVLTNLNDISFNTSIYNKVINELITQNSLLRGISASSVTGQFRRLTRGGAELTKFNFSFVTENSMKIDFSVLPESTPSSNLHVIIGRNGTGKTFLIHKMIESYLNPQLTRDLFIFSSTEDELQQFPNLQIIAFSPFESGYDILKKIESNKSMRLNYFGLINYNPETDKLETKNTDSLLTEFISSLSNIRKKSIEKRWVRYIKMLDTDPNFKDENLSSLIGNKENSLDSEMINFRFSSLSSGHKIVLLSISKLIEKIEEKSLVLMDEPESHLHPPLISSFTRVLSEILIDSNAVGIVATHSPIILQEVPKNCVWKIRRSGDERIAERPRIETFGENVGILIHEIFGLEVTSSGFYHVNNETVNNSDSIDEVFETFKNQLGGEAKAIAFSLFNQKVNEKN